MSHIGMNNGSGALGGMPTMNNSTNGATPRAGSGSDPEEPDYEARLHNLMYDYFLKNEHWECARAILASGIALEPPPRPNDVDVNGAEDPDSKDRVESKRPPDLPLAGKVSDDDHTSFLLEWFALFWDVYFAQRKSGKASTNAMQYVQHSQQQSRMRQEQQQQLLRGMPGMLPTGMTDYQHILRMQQASGMQMNGNDLRQKALQNNRNAYGQPNQAHLAQMQMAKNQQQMMAQHQMRRDPSDVDINGGRPRTPSSADNAPSPSKRARLDGGPPQMTSNGRGPPQGFQQGQMIENQAVHANQLLMQSGINPGTLSELQFASFQQQNPAVQQKSIQVYAQNLARNQQRQSMSKPGMQGPGSPMTQSGLEIGGTGVPSYYEANPAAMQLRGAPTGNGAGGNHALQDYQMQLMLLEQQNKKRLLMARQEQDTTVRPDGQPGMPGAPGFAPVMSPSGSRSGPSPGPNDQIRGTPKMSKAGSPMQDGTMAPTRSPGPMNFANQAPPDMYQQMKGMGEGMVAAVGPNGSIMRPPPSSHAQYTGQMNPQQMEIARAQAAGRMPNGSWQQGPPGQAPIIQQTAQPQQPPQMGTSNSRNTMPPPQALPAGTTVNGRPGSPAQPAAPPTPQQSTKTNPKSKKDDKPRKRPTKKNTAVAVATPASDAENPPSTPITPVHPPSFTGQKGEGQNQPAIMQGPTSAAPAQVAPPQPDPNSIPQFNILDAPDNQYTLEYGDLDNDNVLEHFDFDSFLQSTDDGFAFDPASLAFGNGDPVEAGAGDS